MAGGKTKRKIERENSGVGHMLMGYEDLPYAYGLVMEYGRLAVLWVLAEHRPEAFGKFDRCESGDPGGHSFLLVRLTMNDAEKMPQIPQRPVHAVLGAGLFRSLTIKLHHCLYAHCPT